MSILVSFPPGPKFLKCEGNRTEATVLSPLLFQQGWNITVDLVIGPKGIRQLTSQDAKVERDWGQVAPIPRGVSPSLLPPSLSWLPVVPAPC